MTLTSTTCATTAGQQTLATAAVLRGTGFVTGADVTVRFLPAGPDTGIEFVRADLPDRPRVPALVEHVVERQRRTALQAGGATVEMTEHVLSALAGLGVDNCRVELDAGEAPGMDGSAAPFVEAILAAGLQPQPAPRRPFVVCEPVGVRHGDAVIALLPGPRDHPEITYNLDYPDVPTIGRQSKTVRLNPEAYVKEIAAARTFILEQEIDALRRQGLGKRTTARDLIIFGQDGRPIDNALRFADEPARHKILDVVGDLALFGRPIVGQVFAYKSGHLLNCALVHKLRELTRTTALPRCA